MKLKNVSGADISGPYIPGGHAEAGATIEVNDDLDLIWPEEFWQPVEDKPAKAAAKAKG